jgi:hypothetical protein
MEVVPVFNRLGYLGTCRADRRVQSEGNCFDRRPNRAALSIAVECLSSEETTLSRSEASADANLALTLLRCIAPHLAFTPRRMKLLVRCAAPEVEITEIGVRLGKVTL